VVEGVKRDADLCKDKNREDYTMSDNAALIEEPLVTANDLEDKRILKRSTAYRLAKSGAIPSYCVGPMKSGVRFRISEVLNALRRPIAAETKSHQ